MSLVESLKNDERHEYVLFYEDPKFRKFCSDHQNFKLVCIPPDDNGISRIVGKLAALFGFRSLRSSRYRSIRENKIDILINPASSSIGFRLGLPSIVVIHDLMHKYYPEFPEYSLKSRITRDLTFRRAAKHSVFTVVDSNQGREDLVRFYKIDKRKIKVIPYCPASYSYNYKDLDEQYIASVIDKYGIPDKFIFYPAQFWHHKNHSRLIESIYSLREQFNIKVQVVLVGAQKKDSRDTLPAVTKQIERLKLQNQIFNLGYLPEKELVALYKKSIALVFPSLGGPTNIPILEAMVLGTPVLCSNLFSMPDQVGNAGLLFDPFSVKDMAEKIHRIWTDEDLRQACIQKGYERVKNATLENYAGRWEQVIEEALNMEKRSVV